MIKESIFYTGDNNLRNNFVCRVTKGYMVKITKQVGLSIFGIKVMKVELKGPKTWPFSIEYSTN